MKAEKWFEENTKLIGLGAMILGLTAILNSAFSLAFITMPSIFIGTSLPLSLQHIVALIGGLLNIAFGIVLLILGYRMKKS